MLPIVINFHVFVGIREVKLSNYKSFTHISLCLKKIPPCKSEVNIAPCYFIPFKFKFYLLYRIHPNLSRCSTNILPHLCKFLNWHLPHYYNTSPANKCALTEHLEIEYISTTMWITDINDRGSPKKKKHTPPSVDRQLVDLSNAEAAIDARKRIWWMRYRWIWKHQPNMGIHAFHWKQSGGARLCWFS